MTRINNFEDVIGTGYCRGHKVVQYLLGGSWFLVETGQVLTKELRLTLTCPRCGLPPTPDGHDACCANTPEVKNMCCGHGTHPGYIQYIDGETLYEEDSEHYTIACNKLEGRNNV